jgi:hypothetical protein
MKEQFLLKTKNATALYERVRSLPIIDFHNHLCVADMMSDKKYDDIVSLWLSPDPYKHRLMRICGVDEYFITGDAEPFEKFQKYCEIFPYLAGNPVYDWSRMELARIFGIHEPITKDNARYLYDTAGEMLASPEFSNNGILSRFSIEYQSPVATLLEDLGGFDGKSVINPRQIAPVHSVFNPTQKDIDKAKKIVAAIKEAEARGSGVISLNGKMVDKPVVIRAQRVIELALVSGIITKEEVEAL